MPTQQDLHPVHAYQEGTFDTASGIEICLHYPHASMINIEDIACGLSKICRFGGQTNAFYSVAQHSVLVAALAPDYLKKEALLHDAAEAYIGDIIKPLKHILGKKYKGIEESFNTAIGVHFGVNLHEAAHLVKPFDMMALEMEKEALHNNNLGRLLTEMIKHELSTDDRWAWDHSFAKMIFKTAYHDYFNL